MLSKRRYYVIMAHILMMGILAVFCTQAVTAEPVRKAAEDRGFIVIDSSAVASKMAEQDSSQEYMLLDDSPSDSVIYEEEYSEVHLVSTDFLSKPCEVSGAFLNKKLQGTGLAGLGEAFKNAEQNYGVNAIFLIGLAMHESGNGGSRIAKDKNNLFGFQAYDASPYESARRFSSREEGIDAVARYIAQNYLSSNGKYFNGYSVEAMNLRYATDPNWARGVKSQIVRFLSR